MAAVILGMGAHWMILQSVAWTGMMIQYSQHSTLREALRKTFDGRHPCSICKVVKASRQSAQQHTQQKLLLKLDPFIQEQPFNQRLYRPYLKALIPLFLLCYSSPEEIPPTPPPMAV